MSKQQIVREIIKNKDILGIKNTEQASMIFDYIMDTLKNKLQHLKEGLSFRCHNFGRFYAVCLKPHSIRDFHSGKMIPVSPSRKVRFKFYSSNFI